jgi:hypothetical protein
MGTLKQQSEPEKADAPDPQRQRDLASRAEGDPERPIEKNQTKISI